MSDLPRPQVLDHEEAKRLATAVLDEHNRSDLSLRLSADQRDNLSWRIEMALQSTFMTGYESALENLAFRMQSK